MDGALIAAPGLQISTGWWPNDSYSLVYQLQHDGHWGPSVLDAVRAGNLLRGMDIEPHSAPCRCEACVSLYLEDQ